jgi:phosphoadenosine phosphosulfate reductase
MLELKKENIEKIQAEIKGKSTEEVLTYFINGYGKDLILASSLGAEDQVLTDLLIKIDPKSRIFVLDTGRLNQETYNVMAETKEKYGISYEVCFPNQSDVENLLGKKGPNSMYESIDNRKECCNIRKVAPLRKKLQQSKGWITGLRREQSVTRTDLTIVEWDDAHQIIKINPLAAWSENEVWAYIKENNVPYNALHDQGYPSIGCSACTRAVKPGEDARSGRWWWENPDDKECGLHVVDGKLVRKKKG